MAPETETETTEAPAAPAVAPSSPAPSPAPAPAVEGWRAGLPPELQADKTLERFKDVPALAKSYLEARRTIGGKAEYPAADAKPEAVAEYRKGAGVPETVDGYKLELPTPPEGMEWGAELKGFTQAMHQAHARPEIVQAAVNFYAEHMAKMLDGAKNAQSAEQRDMAASTIAELEKSWGPKGGPMWNRNLARADAAVRTIMDGQPLDSVNRLIDEINRDPALADAFFHASQAYIEDGRLQEADFPAFDPESLTREIEMVREEMGRTNSGSRRHVELNRRLETLYQQRYGRG